MLHALRRASAILASAGLSVGLGAGYTLANDLDQVVSADEDIVPAGTPHEMGSGHADLGAMILDGGAQLLARDDASAPPVWRHLDDVVFTLDEAAAATRPAGEDYDFIGADEGADIWLVPQTQIPDVPWLGWNTQSPSLIEAGARGMTLSLEAHEGEGDVSLFVQSGGFEKPEVLMATEDGIDGEDEIWAEINTHVHANWVFTEPGVHLVRFGVTLDGTDEPAFSETVRFTVGPEAASPQLVDAARSAAEPEATVSSGTNRVWIWGLGAAVILAVVIGIFLWRNKK